MVYKVIYKPKRASISNIQSKNLIKQFVQQIFTPISLSFLSRLMRTINNRILEKNIVNCHHFYYETFFNDCNKTILLIVTDAMHHHLLNILISYNSVYRLRKESS